MRIGRDRFRRRAGGVAILIALGAIAPDAIAPAFAQIVDASPAPPVATPAPTPAPSTTPVISRPSLLGRPPPPPDHLPRLANSRFAKPGAAQKPETTVAPGGNTQPAVGSIIPPPGTQPPVDAKSAVADALRQAAGLASAVGVTLPPSKATPEERGKRVKLPDLSTARILPKLPMRQAGSQGFEPAKPAAGLAAPASE